MERSKIAIIIPAWNEAASIGDVVVSSLPFGDVIVVDDCSKDATAHIAHRSGAVVVIHSENKGYDAALNSGFQEAYSRGYDYLITLDADGAHDPHEIPMFISQIEQNGMDIVVGIRPSKSRIAEAVFGLITRIHWSIPDPLCGMKAYRASLMSRYKVFDRYQSIGTDLMLRVLKDKHPSCSIPIMCKNRKPSSSRFGAGISANFIIFKSLIRGLFLER